MSPSDAEASDPGPTARAPSRAPSLADLGWRDDLDAALAPHRASGGRPGRVARVDRGWSTVLLPEPARIPSRVPVAVGDWVVVAEGGRRDRPREIRAVLPRRSAFVRKHAGSATTEQVVAANVDTVLLVTALDRPLNLRQVERYLTLGWQSGARPVVVLTKADALEEAQVGPARAAVATAAVGTGVHAVSAVDRRGVTALAQAVLAPGSTIALLGPSGAGKSTLANVLAGAEVMSTGEVGAAKKGQHTTSHRQLIVLEGRGLLLDTPGMRELALWDAGEGLAQAFADVEALADLCRFSNCGHHTEPGCAVRAAVEDGTLSAARVDSWERLSQELASLAVRQGDLEAQRARRARAKAVARDTRFRGPGGDG